MGLIDHIMIQSSSDSQLFLVSQAIDTRSEIYIYYSILKVSREIQSNAMQNAGKPPYTETLGKKNKLKQLFKAHGDIPARFLLVVIIPNILLVRHAENTRNRPSLQLGGQCIR